MSQLPFAGNGDNILCFLPLPVIPNTLRMKNPFFGSFNGNHFLTFLKYLKAIGNGWP